MKKKLKKLNFTLIELTVAFGVLAILIMFLTMFLTTAQTSWNFAEKRARAYADSRTALDFIERGIMSANRIENNQIIASGSSMKYTGVLPYDNGDFDADIQITLDNGSLKYNGEEMICNVVNFYCVKVNESYIIRIVMFGSDEDYDAYTELTEDDDKKEFLTQHGFSFTRLINLQ